MASLGGTYLHLSSQSQSVVAEALGLRGAGGSYWSAWRYTDQLVPYSGVGKTPYF